ncbi:MAG TPA: tRNA-dihydrouridine synthase [Candidatus Dojkabacteria bacterium]|nr:tRNA-dihydrouridine synthase [Candidatus Dojkabacteria bacterium]HRO64722.1 tRNA-dihydrouridine synthase [Candidatus Dojkabacteria bacterium]HRP51468.1 tRNA-dihydrouridine synthase [Candidatus Dojkabacteria bacterium]
MNFWRKLEKPIIGLSPMDGVSDASFRFITAKYGEPDVITTEFISVDGIAYGARNIFNDFIYHEIERPIVAQLFGIEPEYFYQGAQIVCELGFDGVDINMGCPAKTVARRGAGAGLIQNPELAREIIRATKRGVVDWFEFGLSKSLNKKTLRELSSIKNTLAELGTKFDKEKRIIPVSVKTRIGYDQEIVEVWVPEILKESPANITVHGRTLKQMYQGEADWSALTKVGHIINDYNEELDEEKRITYIANGDISSAEVALEKLEQSHADGLYIGRATYGNPWIFENIREKLKDNDYVSVEKSLDERISVALEHCDLHYKLNEPQGFVQMRKHLAWYLRGFPGAVKLRVDLMKTNSPDEVRQVLSLHKIAY